VIKKEPRKSAFTLAKEKKEIEAGTFEYGSAKTADATPMTSNKLL